MDINLHECNLIKELYSKVFFELDLLGVCVLCGRWGEGGGEPVDHTEMEGMWMMGIWRNVWLCVDDGDRVCYIQTTAKLFV